MVELQKPLSQDLKKCHPEGRDCIERNSILSFNCSVTCVGMYADVQWVEDKMEDDLGDELEVETNKKFGDDLQKEIYQRLIDLERKMKWRNVEKGEEMDKEKFKMLTKEYQKFKVKNTRHIRFNSASNSTNFGRFSSASSQITLFLFHSSRVSQSNWIDNMFFFILSDMNLDLRRGAATINPSAGSDLL